MNQFARQLFGWAVVVALFAAVAGAAERPNIVIIIADDMGYADVGFNNSPDIKTPNIDRIAKEGCIFTDSYGQQ
jgi:arylsulfatase A-like enzyme